jgi:hypothetical protein
MKAIPKQDSFLISQKTSAPNFQSVLNIGKPPNKYFAWSGVPMWIICFLGGCLAGNQRF